MYDFELKIKLLKEGTKLPTRGTIGSAGLDFYSPKTYILFPRSDQLIPLDLAIELPIGFAMIMKEKSGLAIKKKLDILACVIDSDYRGCIHAHIYNNSNTFRTIKKGSKVCQGIIVPIWNGNIKEIKKLTFTNRGSKGFGSTGE